MLKFEELSALRGLLRMRNDTARAAKLWRRTWMLGIVAVLLLSVAFAINGRGSVKWQRDLCVAIAFLCGAIFNGAFWHALAARQLPLICRYTVLREEEIQARIDVLEHL